MTGDFFNKIPELDNERIKQLEKIVKSNIDYLPKQLSELQYMFPNDKWRKIKFLHCNTFNECQYVVDKLRKEGFNIKIYSYQEIYILDPTVKDEVDKCIMF